MSQRILLCDDELHILRAAEFKFKRAGYEVECAGDGIEAWESIQRQRPDVLITDCQMPRLDGVALAERIHNDPETTDIPVIMLTAKGFELSPAEMAEKFNVLAVITKPFSPRELLKRVQQILAAGPGGQPAAVSSSRSQP